MTTNTNPGTRNYCVYDEHGFAAPGSDYCAECLAADAAFLTALAEQEKQAAEWWKYERR